jgi:hypothetical protein
LRERYLAKIQHRGMDLQQMSGRTGMPPLLPNDDKKATHDKHAHLTIVLGIVKTHGVDREGEVD